MPIQDHIHPPFTGGWMGTVRTSGVGSRPGHARARSAGAPAHGAGQCAWRPFIPIIIASPALHHRVAALARDRIAGGPAHRPPGFKWATNRSESLGSSPICERGIVEVAAGTAQLVLEKETMRSEPARVARIRVRTIKARRLSRVRKTRPVCHDWYDRPLNRTCTTN